MASACAAAPAAGSATCSLATHPTRQPSAAASARSASGANAEPDECAAASTAVLSPADLAALIARGFGGGRGISATMRHAAGTAGPGSGCASRSSNETVIGARGAAGSGSSLRSTTSFRWQPGDRTSRRTYGRCASIATRVALAGPVLLAIPSASYDRIWTRPSPLFRSCSKRLDVPADVCHGSGTTLEQRGRKWLLARTRQVSVNRLEDPAGR